MNEQLLDLQHQETNSKANKQNSKMLINVQQRLIKNSPFPNFHLFLKSYFFLQFKIDSA